MLISYELVKSAIKFISNEAGEVLKLENSSGEHVFAVLESGIVEYTKNGVLVATIYVDSGDILTIEVYVKFTVINFKEED